MIAEDAPQGHLKTSRSSCVPDEAIGEDASIHHSVVPDLASHCSQVAAHARKRTFPGDCLNCFAGEYRHSYEAAGRINVTLPRALTEGLGNNYAQEKRPEAP